MKNIPTLPLYYSPVPSCSRTAWFLAGFLFAFLLVLAPELPTLFYSLFNFFINLFYLAIGFYKSETGQIIVNYIKRLVIDYNKVCSTINLMDKMDRGDNMTPSFLTWLLQDYSEVAAPFLRRVNPIILNRLYNKTSEKLLNSVCINNKKRPCFPLNSPFKFLSFSFLGS
jgi:hypothetical protein